MKWNGKTRRRKIKRREKLPDRTILMEICDKFWSKSGIERREKESVKGISRGAEVRFWEVRSEEGDFFEKRGSNKNGEKQITVWNGF